MSAQDPLPGIGSRDVVHRLEILNLLLYEHKVTGHSDAVRRGDACDSVRVFAQACPGVVRKSAQSQTIRFARDTGWDDDSQPA